VGARSSDHNLVVAADLLDLVCRGDERAGELAGLRRRRAVNLDDPPVTRMYRSMLPSALWVPSISTVMSQSGLSLRSITQLEPVK
jgi:hypothetical protein